MARVTRSECLYLGYRNQGGTAVNSSLRLSKGFFCAARRMFHDKTFREMCAGAEAEKPETTRQKQGKR